jgi:hypothetical protein
VIFPSTWSHWLACLLVGLGTERSIRFSQIKDTLKVFSVPLKDFPGREQTGRPELGSRPHALPRFAYSHLVAAILPLDLLLPLILPHTLRVLQDQVPVLSSGVLVKI